MQVYAQTTFAKKEWRQEAENQKGKKDENQERFLKAVVEIRCAGSCLGLKCACKRLVWVHIYARQGKEAAQNALL